MSASTPSMDPEWDTPLPLTVTPEEIVHTIFSTAEHVHTGWESCVAQELVVADTLASHEQSGFSARFVEQEYADDTTPDVTWHDWAIELKFGDVHVVGHWRAETSGSPSEWEWCANAAEEAFKQSCVLIGKRVRRGLVVEDSPRTPQVPRVHH